LWHDIFIQSTLFSYGNGETTMWNKNEGLSLIDDNIVYIYDTKGRVKYFLFL
jgi:hypothetical protein